MTRLERILIVVCFLLACLILARHAWGQESEIPSSPWEFRAELTAYTRYCRGCSGVTAWGTNPVAGRTLACPNFIPFGTKVELRGVGEFICEDRGGDMNDVLPGPTIRFDVYVDGNALGFGRRRTWGRVTWSPLSPRKMTSDVDKRPLM